MADHCPLPECPINPELTEHRIGSLERAVQSIAESVRSIADNTAQIARLEERHSETREGLDRAFGEVRDIKLCYSRLAGRVVIIETDMPGLRETRANVMRAVWGLAGVVCLALVGMVLIK